MPYPYLLADALAVGQGGQGECVAHTGKAEAHPVIQALDIQENQVGGIKDRLGQL